MQTRFIAALHVRNLTTDELRGAARFLETEASQTALSPADKKRRFDDFILSPVGVRVEEFDGFLSRELPRALVDYADKAIEIYVRERGLPNRRKAVP